MGRDGMGEGGRRGGCLGQVLCLGWRGNLTSDNYLSTGAWMGRDGKGWDGRGGEGLGQVLCLGGWFILRALILSEDMVCI